MRRSILAPASNGAPGHCDPLRCASASLERETLGPVGAVARVRRASGIPVWSAQCRSVRLSHGLSARPAVLVGAGRGAPIHLHQLDAASALLAAAKLRAAGKIYYATDGRAVSFMQFMDAFAHRVGRPKPLHLPPYSQPLARLIIRKEHMQQTALAMSPRAPSPRLPGWKPKFADYRKGLDQVIEVWRDAREVRSKEQ